MVSGWGAPETSSGGSGFTWVVEDHAVVETELLETGFDELVFRCRPFSWDGSPEQRVAVAVNGRNLGEVVLTSGFVDSSLRLPPEVLVIGRNVVDLSFAWTASPSDHLPGNTDQRSLAAAFQWLRFGSGSTPGVEGETPGTPEVRGDAVAVPAATGLRYRLVAPADPVLEMDVSFEPGEAGAPGLLVAVTDAAGSGAARTTELSSDKDGGRFRLELDAQPGDLLDLVVAATGMPGNAGKLILHTPRILGSGSGSDVTPSVLLIVVDTLRADYLGCYGAEVDTPVVDGLAAAGVRFVKARSHIPITGPSHASLFTSLLPMEHGVVNNAQEFRRDLPTLAESLGAGGRRTAAVISLGVLKGKFGFSRGFDEYGDDFPRDWLKDAAEVTDEALSMADGFAGAPWFLWAHYSDPHEPYAPTDGIYPRFELRLDGEYVGTIDAGGRGFRFDIELPPGQSVLEFVPVDEGEPGRVYRVDNLLVNEPKVEVEPLEGWNVIHRRNERFTYESLMPASARLINSGRFRLRTKVFISCKKLLKKTEIREAYAAETEFVDGQIGRLLTGLESRRLMENTLIVFLSDHGEGLGDHNHVGHISQVYDSLLHVPLIFSWPGRLPAGLVVDRPVSLIDVFPTIAELTGSRRPERVAGASLAPLINGADSPDRSVIAATYRPESFSDKRAIVLDGFKYIHSWKDEGEKEELYDMDLDPGELRDLSQSRPEVLERLRVELARRLAEIAESSPTEAELSEEEKAHLRALGYIH